MFRRKSALEKARVLWRQGQQADALAALEEVASDPGQAFGCLCQLLAWYLLSGDREGIARTCLRLGKPLGIHEAQPPTPAAAELEALRAALDEAQPASTQRDPFARYLCIHAGVLDAQGQTRNAGRLYQAAARRDPDNLSANIGLAQSLLTLEVYPTALELVDRFLERFPECLDLYRIGSLAAAAAGDAALANDYRHAWMLLDPTRLEWLNEVGPWLYESGNLPACAELYGLALRQTPDDLESLNVLGNLKLELAERGLEPPEAALAEARELLRNSLALNPQQDDIRATLQTVLQRLGSEKPAAGQVIVGEPADMLSGAALSSDSIVDIANDALRDPQPPSSEEGIPLGRIFDDEPGRPG